MNFIHNNFAKIFCGFMTWASCQGHGQETAIDKIQKSVFETISHADQVPGLKAEEFSKIKEGIIERWTTLTKTGSLVIATTDKVARPYFVAIQGIVEHILSTKLNGEIQKLVGIIHTPMPATPLCTDGTVSLELVDESVLQDSARLFTVKARTTIVRDFLHNGGDLYVAYPKGGLAKRTEHQQNIYQEECRKNPLHLIDTPLECDEIPTALIGATYFFTTSDGKKFVFAIKMTQANNTFDEGQFGLWFGPESHPDIQERVSAVQAFLRCASPSAYPLLDG